MITYHNIDIYYKIRDYQTEGSLPGLDYVLSEMGSSFFFL